MKVDPAIIIKDNQICNKNGEVINLRAYTVDNFVSNSDKITKLDTSDLETSFESIKKRGCQMIRWVVYWNIIEPEEGEYNEEYLATLREYIKKAGKSGLLVYIVPKISFTNNTFWTKNTYPIDKIIDGETAGMYYMRCFTDAMNHLARRVKDCENIVGFAIPECFDEIMNASSVAVQTQQDLSMLFMQVLYKKHTQYYFIAEENDKNDIQALKNINQNEYKIITGVFLANHQILFIC